MRRASQDPSTAFGFYDHEITPSSSTESNRATGAELLRRADDVLGAAVNFAHEHEKNAIISTR